MRSGTTEKVSVSLDAGLLKTLRRRAKRLYAGNLSAVLSEAAETAARLEAQDEVIARFDLRVSDADRLAIETEWAAPRKRARSR